MVLLTTVALLGCMAGMVQGYPPDQPGQNKNQDALGVLYFLSKVHSTTFTVFLHHGFGSEALGFPGLFAFLLLCFCSASEPLMRYWLIAFLVAVVIQRIITFRRLRKGQ